MRNNVCARKMKSQTENIMKQFNLEEYLKNPSKKVVTRDGRNVKIHCTNYIGAQHIIAQVEGNDYSSSFSNDGRFIVCEESRCDLFFAPEKHEGWVNIYKAGVQRETLGYLQTRYVGSSIWRTEEAAKTAADADDIVTIKIEWEE